MDNPTSQPFVPTPASAPMTTPVNPVMPPTPETRWGVLASVLVGAIVLGIAAYALVSKTYNTAYVVPTYTPYPSVSASASATADVTAGWKTYTNTQYGFSLSYPSSWSYRTVGPSSIGFFGPEGSITFDSAQTFNPNARTGPCTDMVFAQVVEVQTNSGSILICEVDFPHNTIGFETDIQSKLSSQWQHLLVSGDIDSDESGRILRGDKTQPTALQILSTFKFTK